MYLADPWKLLPTTYVAKIEVLDLQHMFIKSSYYSSNIGEISMFSLKFSECKTDVLKNQ